MCSSKVCANKGGMKQDSSLNPKIEMLISGT